MRNDHDDHERTLLLERIEELESYLRGFCLCPCCEGVEACAEDCTIIEDSNTVGGAARERVELMQEVRRLLYGEARC